MADIRVKAPAEACIDAAGELKRELISALDRAGAKDTVILDLSEVQRSDSSLAQLAISFSAEAFERGIRVSLSGDSSDRSLSDILACDVTCEACAFKKFREHTRAAPGKKAV